MYFQCSLFVFFGFSFFPQQVFSQEVAYSNLYDLNGDWVLSENQGPCYQTLSFKFIKDGIQANFGGDLIGLHSQNDSCGQSKSLVAVKGLAADGAFLETLDDGYLYTRLIRASVGFKKELYSFRSAVEDPMDQANHLNFDYAYSITRSMNEVIQNNLTLGGTSNCYYERMPEVRGR